MNREDVIIELYCVVECAVREILGVRKLRLCGRVPGLSDAEVLTIEIFGEMCGHHDDAAIWRYAKDHWQDWFPGLGSYKAFVKQCANLLGLKQAVFGHLFPACGPVHILDGMPIPVCHKARSARCTLFDDAVAFGFCAAKNEHYYGFKGHVLIDENKCITAFTLAPANVDEREVAKNWIGHIKGRLIGDKGYLSQPRRNWPAIISTCKPPCETICTTQDQKPLSIACSNSAEPSKPSSDNSQNTSTSQKQRPKHSGTSMPNSSEKSAHTISR